MMAKEVRKDLTALDRMDEIADVNDSLKSIIIQN